MSAISWLREAIFSGNTGHLGDHISLHKAYNKLMGQPVIDVTSKVYGALPDLMWLPTDGAMTAGDNKLNSPSAPFTATNVTPGQIVGVAGAGAAGAPLITTVDHYISATQIQLSASASTTVSGKSALWGTDNSAAFQAAVNDAHSSYHDQWTGYGGLVRIPWGRYLGAFNILPGVGLTGDGPWQTVISGPPGSSATAIIGSDASLTPDQVFIKQLHLDGLWETFLDLQTLRGIDLRTPGGDAFTTPGVSDRGTHFIADVAIRGIGGSHALYVGSNMTNGYQERIFIRECKKQGAQFACTDNEIADLQVGGCADGVLITNANNKFVNCKSWWHGPTINSGWPPGGTFVGSGHAWKLSGGHRTSMANCESQDTEGMGLYLVNTQDCKIKPYISGADQLAVCYLDGTTKDNDIDISVIWGDRTAGLSTCVFSVNGTGVNHNKLHAASSEDGVGSGYIPIFLAGGAQIYSNDWRHHPAHDAFQGVTLGAGTYTPDLHLGRRVWLLLTANVTIGGMAANGISRGIAGEEIVFYIVQDATGGRTVTWDSSYHSNGSFGSPESIIPPPKSTPNSVSIYRFQNASSSNVPFWVLVEHTFLPSRARIFNSTGISIPNNSVVTLPFDSTRFDTNAMHGFTNSRMFAPISGDYLIGAHVQWSGNANDIRLIWFQVNGTGAIPAAFSGPGIGATGTPDYTMTTLWRLNAGDYVEVKAFQASGATLTINNVASYSPEFWMTLLAKNS